MDSKQNWTERKTDLDPGPETRFKIRTKYGIYKTQSLNKNDHDSSFYGCKIEWPVPCQKSITMYMYMHVMYCYVMVVKLERIGFRSMRMIELDNPSDS